MARDILVFNLLKCRKGSIPVDVMITRNHNQARPVPLQKATHKLIEKFLCYGILGSELSFVIVGAQRNTLNDVPADNYGLRCWNAWIFLNVSVTVAH